MVLAMGHRLCQITLEFQFVVGEYGWNVKYQRYCLLELLQFRVWAGFNKFVTLVTSVDKIRYHM